jgi:hypothetical protein
MLARADIGRGACGISASIPVQYHTRTSERVSAVTPQSGILFQAPVRLQTGIFSAESVAIFCNDKSPVIQFVHLSKNSKYDRVKP